MLMQPDCFPCVLNMALSTVRRLNLDEATERHLYSRILNLPHLKGARWDITNEEAIETVINVIIDDIGNPDPFHELKFKRDERMMKIAQGIQSLINTDPDPLFVAMKAATFGNAVDVMVSNDTDDLENHMAKMMRKFFPRNNFFHFSNKLKAVQSVLYFTDNAGEIVLDKLLIGAEHIVANTDFGQVLVSEPIEGFRLFIRGMLHWGISKEDIKTMIQTNSTRLLYLDE